MRSSRETWSADSAQTASEEVGDDGGEPSLVGDAEKGVHLVVPVITDIGELCSSTLRIHEVDELIGDGLVAIRTPRDDEKV